MVAAGYDDVQSMSSQMLTPMPITEQHLRSIGIVKPGHCRRILMKLEEEAGIYQISLNKKSQELEPTEKEGVLRCCIAPSGATACLYAPPTIKE